MKKILLCSAVVLSLFLTGCSNHKLEYFKFPSNVSYTFELDSSNVITKFTSKSYDSQNKKVVKVEEPKVLQRSKGADYTQTIENPARYLDGDNGKKIVNENYDALKNIGFTFYEYSGFTDIEYKYMYELDCSKNTDAMTNNSKSFYIFSKMPLDVINGLSVSDFIKDDKKSHICLDETDGKIYLVADKENTPNFLVIERGETLMAQTGYNRITVTSSEDEILPVGLLNIIIKDFAEEE